MMHSHSVPQVDHITYPAPDPARPYVYPGTRVLINLFGIDDMLVLERVVASVAGLRGEQVERMPLPGDFSLTHLCAIHRHLFQDVFAWAGVPRSVDTEKLGRDFCPASRIADAYAAIHSRLASEGFLHGLAAESFADRLADYYHGIYAVHPFRDGNSRSLRHYCAQLARAAGHRLDFTRIKHPSLFEACRQHHFNSDPAPLRECMRRIVDPA